MINKYDKATNLYEKKTDWGAVLGVIIVVCIGIAIAAG